MANPKRVPVSDIKALAEKNGYQFAVVFLWDPESNVQSVVTWGKSLALCENAAILGNKMKEGLGWPSDQCKAKPARAKRKEQTI